MSTEMQVKLDALKAKQASAIAEAVPTVEAEKVSNIRIFRSRIPNSRYVFENGREVFFTAGWYETSDPREIEQLDKVANKAPTIYTDAHEKEVIAALLKAREGGFSGDLGTLMNQELTMEARLHQIALASGGIQTLNVGASGGILPPGNSPLPQGDIGASLRQAIRQASAAGNS